MPIRPKTTGRPQVPTKHRNAERNKWSLIRPSPQEGDQTQTLLRVGVRDEDIETPRKNKCIQATKLREAQGPRHKTQLKGDSSGLKQPLSSATVPAVSQGAPHNSGSSSPSSSLAKTKGNLKKCLHSGDRQETRTESRKIKNERLPGKS